MFTKCGDGNAMKNRSTVEGIFVGLTVVAKTLGNHVLFQAEVILLY